MTARDGAEQRHGDEAPLPGAGVARLRDLTRLRGFLRAVSLRPVIVAATHSVGALIDGEGAITMFAMAAVAETRAGEVKL